MVAGGGLGMCSLICATHGAFLSVSSARWVLIACCVLLTKLGPSVVCASAADYAGLWFVLTVLGFASSLGRTHHLSVAAFPSLFIMLSMYTL